MMVTTILNETIEAVAPSDVSKLRETDSPSEALSSNGIGVTRVTA
jgi:hypothetical protein